MKLFSTKFIELLIADIASIVDLVKEAIEDQLDQEKEENAALDIASEGLENTHFILCYIYVYFSLSHLSFQLEIRLLLSLSFGVSFASLFYLGKLKIILGFMWKNIIESHDTQTSWTVRN